MTHQLKHNVTIVVYSTSLSADESIYICGSDSLLGNWNPGLIKLKKINDSTWMKNFEFDKNEILEFKFTKGDWSNEAANKDGSIPQNYTFNVISDTTLTYQINSWKKSETKIIHGQITGTVKYHLNFHGKDLKPRDIIVWLPPSYFSDTTKHYPVLYMHDGQNIIDPTTSAFGYDWQVDEVADSLIKFDIINEIIIVGIYNTSDRMAEYNYTPLGYKYMDFIVSRLKPFVDNEYRTLSDRNNTATAGSSLGGLVSFMMVWNYPHIFSEAACLSPTFKVNKFNYVDSVQSYNGPKKDLKLYIDNGEVGSENKLLPGVNEMISVLQEKGYKLGEDLIFILDSNGIHSETSWAKRVWRPLVYFFGKN
jgi:predicted alpha/beta superfamily hydrolase